MKPSGRSGLLFALILVALLASFGLGAAWRERAKRVVSLAGSIRGFDVASNLSASPGPQSNRKSVVVDIAQRVSPAVVTIGVTVASRQLTPLDLLSERLFSSPGEDSRSLRFGRTTEQDVPYVGSGFIVSQASVLAPGQKAKVVDAKAVYVLTNYHVVQDVRRINVTLTDGRSYEAKLLDADAVVDVALLQLMNTGNDEIPTVTLGSSSDIMVGETTIALGNPFGPIIDDPHPTVTVGVVSALNRSFQPEMDERSGAPRVYRNMIQTDASVNPGNSGGPLVNLDGEVIGINTFIISPGGRGSSGVNFATPINRAVAVAREILQYGSVRSIRLDFEVYPLSRSIARRYGLKDSKGLLIYKIAPNGPAHAAGLEQADVLLKIEGKDLKEPDDLLGHVYSSTVGEKLKLTVSRDGRVFQTEYQIQAGDSN